MAFTQRSSLLNYLYLQVHHCKICLTDEKIFLLAFLNRQNKSSVMKPLRILLFGVFCMYAKAYIQTKLKMSEYVTQCSNVKCPAATSSIKAQKGTFLMCCTPHMLILKLRCPSQSGRQHDIINDSAISVSPLMPFSVI